MGKRKTQLEFNTEVYEMHGDEYVVLGEYVRSNVPIEILHTVCGTINKMRPNNLLSGATCLHCTNRLKVKSTEDFKEEVNTLSKGRLKVISDYIDCDTNVVVYCNIHKTKTCATPTNILNGHFICKKCTVESIKSNQTHSNADFLVKLAKVNHSIDACEPYQGVHKSIMFKCKECKTTFVAEPNSVLRGSSCPTCNKSRGERLVESALIDMGIKFEAQKRFKECRAIRPLPFDFFVPCWNLLIEYDGLQHEKPIDFFGGTEAFEKRQKYDQIKEKFAKEHNIKLLRIPYNTSKEHLLKTLKEVKQEALSDRA